MKMKKIMERKNKRDRQKEKGREGTKKYGNE